MPECIEPPPSVGSSQCCMMQASNILAVLQGLAHDGGIGDADAVVAQGDGAALDHRADFGQFACPRGPW